MSRQNTERRTKLTLLDPPSVETAGPSPADAATPESEGLAKPALRRTELSLESLATELKEALIHVERATLVSKGTGFTGRLREALDELDELQRSASEEFGRKVGHRLGREALWRRHRGVDA